MGMTTPVNLYNLPSCGKKFPPWAYIAYMIFIACARIFCTSLFSHWHPSTLWVRLNKRDNISGVLSFLLAHKINNSPATARITWWQFLSITESSRMKTTPTQLLTAGSFQKCLEYLRGKIWPRESAISAYVGVLQNIALWFCISRPVWATAGSYRV